MVSEIESGDLLDLVSINSNKKIYAGPGAGKTYFLVNNIKNMFKENTKIYKSKNRKILCITYTNSAVEEIKNRLEGYEENVEICTIHTFIIKYIISVFQTELKRIIKLDYGVEIGEDKKVSSQIEGVGILHGVDKNDIFKYINDNLSTAEELNYSKKIMGDVKININRYIEAGVKELQASASIKQSHVISIKKYLWGTVGKLNHDEILYFGYRIIEENPTILYALRVQFPYIFIDEFQDTNPLQTKLLLKICEKISKVTVIGDVAQSIYSFQGARPSQFVDFSLENIKEYKINGNRRSTANIVELCNYIRRDDELKQISIKEYLSLEEKQKVEKNLVHFVLNNSQDKVQSIINDILSDDGAIITRTWAGAFNYITDVSNEQKILLQKIYHTYYATPIDIRYEISESANVLWIKAIKFIMYINETYKTRTLNNFFNAIHEYRNIEPKDYKKIFSIRILVKLNRFLEEVFGNVNNDSKIIKIIEDFNNALKKSDNEEIKNFLNQVTNIEDFEITLFSDDDRETLKNLINNLEWHTAWVLFKDVFSKNSKYMTVHQAKGLEWKRVFINVFPTRSDSTSFSQIFQENNIRDENSCSEFIRLFYVACSRAKEELFICIEKKDKDVIEENLNKYIKENGLTRFYDFME